MQTMLKRCASIPVKREVEQGIKITNPSAYLSPEAAIKLYQQDRTAKAATAYYEEQGQPVPEFDKMDKIERLQAFTEWRNKAIQLRDKLRKNDDEAYHKMNIAKAENKAKEDAAKQQQPNTAAGKDKG